MKKNYDLGKLKEVSRGPLAEKKATKIQKTVRLDSDIVEWLISKSSETEDGYLTLLNAELRLAMQRDLELNSNPQDAFQALEAALVKTATDVSRAQSVLSSLKRTSGLRKSKRANPKGA